MQKFDQCTIENIANGDVNISLPRPVSIENLIECPDCQSPTSRYAPMCPQCSFPVADFFEGIKRREANKRNAIITSAVGITLFLLATGMLYFNMPEHPYRAYVPAVALTAALVLGLYRYVAFKVTNR